MQKEYEVREVNNVINSLNCEGKISEIAFALFMLIQNVQVHC